MKTWSCKIGEVDGRYLPDGADQPMRQAVAAAYKALTGEDNVFIFSGWGTELTEEERAVVEDRDPRPAPPPAAPEKPGVAAAAREDVQSALRCVRMALGVYAMRDVGGMCSGPQREHNRHVDEISRQIDRLEAALKQPQQPAQEKERG